MAKKGAGKKVGKQKQGKDKDFAGSGVEGEKSSDPATVRRVGIVGHVSRLNIELTNIAIVLAAVQVETPDATEAEVVAAIAEHEAQKNATANPPEMTIAEKIVRIKEVLAELDREDLIIIITAAENDTELEDTFAVSLVEKIGVAFDEEDFTAALRQIQTENPINIEPTDKETAAKAHIEKIVTAIDELDPNNKKDFTESGKPDANVLADILNKKVSAADRDKAWKIHQAQDRPITIDQILKRKRRGGMLI